MPHPCTRPWWAEHLPITYDSSIRPATNTVSVPGNRELVVSIDTLVAGIHFPGNAGPSDIGYKALAVNLSDMAAMGADPLAVNLSFTLPARDHDWLHAFGEGFLSIAERFGTPLVDAQVATGSLSITVLIYGTVPVGQALRRDTARADDKIYVTGTLGDAGVALLGIPEGLSMADPNRSWLESRLNRPEPRIAVGRALRGIASSAIDISDGLTADLGHILEESHVGATVYANKLPLSPSVLNTVGRDKGTRAALSAGDDYELCITVPPEKEPVLEQSKKTLDCPLTFIGTIKKKPGLNCLGADGSVLAPATGYEHFV